MRFDTTDWLAWAVAVLAMAYGGACLRPWASHYAVHLGQGALPDAATLWGAAATAMARVGGCLRPAATAGGRSLCPAVVDGAWGLLWAVAAGTVLARWGMAALPGLLLCLCLVALAWIDARSGLLPDALTAPMMVAGWLWGPLSIVSASSASALVWAALAGLAGGYRWLRGRDGFGAGDVKCLAALAAWLGVEGTASVLCQACALGVCFWVTRQGLTRLQSQLYSWHRPLPVSSASPFGPCIALAAVPAIFGVPALQSWF